MHQSKVRQLLLDAMGKTLNAHPPHPKKNKETFPTQLKLPRKDYILTILCPNLNS